MVGERILWRVIPKKDKKMFYLEDAKVFIYSEEKQKLKTVQNETKQQCCAHWTKTGLLVCLSQHQDCLHKV